MVCPSRHRRGFTLIEIVVVIGIIGLLMAILLPVISSVRARARQVACMSNQGQILLAVKSYAADHSGYFPKCPARRESHPTFTNPFVMAPGSHNMASTLKGYLDDSRLLICPVSEFDTDCLVQGYVPASSLQLVTSYSYYWNYGAWDNRVVPGGQSRGAFIGPRSMMDTKGDDLMIADTSVLNSASSTGSFYVSHPYPNAKPDQNGLWKSTQRPPNDLIMNAGYRDGSVRTYRFSDTHIAVYTVLLQFTVYLPPVR